MEVSCLYFLFDGHQTLRAMLAFVLLLLRLSTINAGPNVAVADGEDIAPIRLAARFNSPLCRNFYAESPPPGPLMTWETLSKEHSTKWHCRGAIVDVCPRQRLAYVMNLKAGSSTTREMLKDNYNCSESDWSWTNQPDGIGFTHSPILNETVVSDYFFFSVVRDPLERFISSYKEILYLHRDWRNLTISDIVKEYRDANVEAHTSTQACLLSGTDENDNQVPMHFIAKLETLYEDFNLMFEYLGMPVPAEYQAMRTAETMPFKSTLDTDLTAAEIRSLCDHLMQDYVCFDYELPDICK